MKKQLILSTLVLAGAVSAQDFSRQIILQCEAEYPTINIPHSDQARMSKQTQLQQQCVQQLITKMEQKPSGPPPFKDRKVTERAKSRVQPKETPKPTTIPQN